MSDIQKYYDLTAESTAKEWYHNNILMPTHIDFISLLPKNPRILDLGCGSGYESKRLHSLGANILGIDISSESISIAKLNNPECNFIAMDFFQIDKFIGQFDGILSSGSLIHVPQSRITPLLLTLSQTLNVKGILATIIRDGSGQMISHPIVNEIALERIIYFYTKQELISYCQDCKFKYIRDGILDKSLIQSGWRCYFFEKN
jgi:2-polyprenyl-3-methyl-5-hydroxy-6-metoxy-1,4-benzoquinol methylase